MLPHPLVSILLQEIFRLCGFWWVFLWCGVFFMIYVAKYFSPCLVKFAHLWSWGSQVLFGSCVRMVSCGSLALFRHFKTKKEPCCCCGKNQCQCKSPCKPKHLSCIGASSPQTLWFLAFPFLGWLGFLELFSDSLSQEAWPGCLLSVLLPERK